MPVRPSENVHAADREQTQRVAERLDGGAGGRGLRVSRREA